jgi:pimeloyl-ACP methyl ester carboxylesterase
MRGDFFSMNQTDKVTSTRYDTRIPSSTTGIELHIHYRVVDHSANLPTVLLSHGFTIDGTESHRMFLTLADAYNESGFNTVLFDHRGCGYSDGVFEEFIFSSAVEDIKVVARWAQRTFSGRAASLVVHGQSLGTAIASVAFQDSSQVEAFVLWNLSAQIYERYLDILGPAILETGIACVEEKGLYVRRAFLDDVKRYDILGLFNSWHHPVLFLSSGADTLGNPEFAARAARAVGSLGKRVVVDGAVHTFRCQPKLEQKAIHESVKWVMAVTGKRGKEPSR